MIDTWSTEWRRICEARWVVRECRDPQRYYEGVLKFRGEAGHQQLLNDVLMVRPHMQNFTKRVAAELIEKMKGQAA